MSTAALTALGAVLVALTGLLGAVLALINGLKKSVQEVHQLVNQESTDAKKYREVLREALTKAGIDVPRDPSVDRVDSNG